MGNTPGHLKRACTQDTRILGGRARARLPYLTKVGETKGKSQNLWGAFRPGRRVVRGKLGVLSQKRKGGAEKGAREQLVTEAADIPKPSEDQVRTASKKNQLSARSTGLLQT